MGDVERGSWVDRPGGRKVYVVGTEVLAKVYPQDAVQGEVTWGYWAGEPTGRHRGTVSTRSEAMLMAAGYLRSAPAPSEQGRSDVDGDRMERRGDPVRNVRAVMEITAALRGRQARIEQPTASAAFALSQVVQKLVRWYAGDDPEECARDACGWIDIALRCEREGER